MCARAGGEQAECAEGGQALDQAGRHVQAVRSLCSRGTLPYICTSLASVADVYPRSRILIFVHPGSRIHKQQEREGWCPTFFAVINIT